MPELTGAEFQENFLNPGADLPYDVSPDQIANAIQDFYEFMYDLNTFLTQNGYERIEKILRANNALSDFCGDIITQNVADECPSLIKNRKQDGFPDLLPREENDDYVDDDGAPYHEKSFRVHHGEHGIETKCSKQSGGWQAHNVESAWIMVFRYRRGDPDADPHEMAPIEFVQVLAAQLVEDDWSYSGRSDDSRRTITASIVAPGMDKLRSNPIYQNPDFITGPNRDVKQRYYELQEGFDDEFTAD